MDCITTTRRLRWARVQLGLSLRNAAGCAGINFQQVWTYENGAGKTALSMENIRKLCRVYMATAKLLEYDEAQYHESELCPGEFPQPATKPAEVA